jgi:hypothetical protein
MKKLIFPLMASLFINFVTVVHAQSKDDIFQVQRLLNSLGFDAGIADGLYGAKTDTALTLFFKSISQAYDGTLDQDDMSLIKKVFNDRPQTKSNNPSVISTEIYLNEHVPLDMEAALASITEIKNYGFNTLTIGFYCGITSEYIKSKKQWHEMKKRRIQSGLIKDCYIPKISTFWVPSAKLYDGNALYVYSKYAHDLGLKVHIKPMHLEHTVTYGPQKMPLKVFWDGNKKFSGFEKSLKNVAELANNVNADALVVGTELTNLNSKILKSDRWSSVLQEVKNNYNGPLYYAHNLGPKGSHRTTFDILSFAKHLDFIGINYFPTNLMKGKKSYSQEDVVRALETARVDNQSMMQAVEDLYKKSQKKVILTESHFPSWKGAANWMFRGSCDYYNKNKRDWVFTKGPLAPKIPDLNEPVKLARAWHATFENKSFLEGYNYPFWVSMPYYGFKTLSPAEKNDPQLFAKKKLKYENDFDCSGSIFHKKSGLKEYLKSYHAR